MIVSNNEKTFTCVSFYTVDEKLCEYENCFGDNLKTGTNWFNPGYRHSIPKTGTVLAKPGQLECLRKMPSWIDNSDFIGAFIGWGSNY